MAVSRFIMILGTIVLLLAAGVIGVGVFWRVTYKTVEAAEPARVDVDFSRVGEYTGTFHQAYQYGHDEGLELQLTPGFGSFEDAAPLIRGLAGEVCIKNADGVAVYRGPLPHQPWEGSGSVEMQRYKLGFVPLALFKPFAVGDYTLSIRVDQPVPGLAGRSQQVMGKHWLCGCEGLLGSNLAFMFGGAVALVGGLIVAGGRSLARGRR